jgi:protein-disulfide isomerase
MRIRKAGKTLAIWLLACSPLLAQQSAGKEDLPGIDLTGLNATQKATVLNLLSKQGCSCGCSMKIAECRVKDPACTYSRGLAMNMIEAIKKGGSEKEAIEAAANSQFAHPAQPDNRLLSDPIPLPTEGAPVTGPVGAGITLVEFSDFQCPYCVAAVPELQALLKAFPKDVKLIFKQYPLETHSQAAFAAAAALAAHLQGKFWPMHDALFAHHDDLSQESVFLIAKSIGLDMRRFESDVKSQQVRQNLEKDIADGDWVGVPGTPTLYINGQRLNGPLRLEVLKPVLEQQLKFNHADVKTAEAGVASRSVK